MSGVCYKCGDKGHWSRECPKAWQPSGSWGSTAQTSGYGWVPPPPKAPPPPPTQPQPPSNTWNDGRPRIWCIHHGKYVAHTSDECWLAGKGAAQGKGQPTGKGHSPAPYPTPNPKSRPDRSEPFEMATREAVASALPQFAKELLLANIQWGLDLKFMRATTAHRRRSPSLPSAKT